MAELMVSLLGAVFAAAAEPRDFIRVSTNGHGFVFSDSGRTFTPWGFNYDHDAQNRLIEEYWAEEWDSVVEDFSEMKALGATVVRIHLQVSHFMRSAEEPNSAALDRLRQLLAVAEKNRLYLDLTGLGCYDKAAVPRWYNDLGEADRWQAQARFWEVVAKTCANSPAVFCYDLMNEPIVTEDQEKRDWTPGAFGDRYFVQRITLDFAGREPRQIAKAWVEKLVSAIRSQDERHLITVGVVPWALTWPTAKPLFYSEEVSRNLDFVSVHFYPKSGEVPKALEALKVYNIGKPLVIEEMFPLNCSLEELGRFIDGSKTIASGWVGFYWGKTIDDYRKSDRTIGEAITLNWLEFFKAKTAAIQANP